MVQIINQHPLHKLQSIGKGLKLLFNENSLLTPEYPHPLLQANSGGIGTRVLVAKDF
jgi:hypothetical protein